MRIESLHLSAVLVVSAALSWMALGCGGSDLECGPGAKDYGGRCVAAIGSCAPGTALQDGICVSLCETGEYWNGNKCMPDKQCAPGTTLVGDACVPACDTDTYWDGVKCTDVPFCAEGTIFDADAGSCTPNEEVCAAGTHFEQGKCVPDATGCGDGTHLEGEVCVPDVLPAPDVTESPDTEGTATFDLPAAGDTITLGGAVDTPQDLDGDGFVDADYDRFSFEGQAGSWLRVHATSEGATHPAMVLISEERDEDGYVLYSRYCINPLTLDAEREFYLPRDGAYTLMVSDYNHVVADVYGWTSLPVGGDDFTYLITVENLGTPTPKAITSGSATETGNLTDGALQFFLLEGLQKHDARDVVHVGVPAGQFKSDVFAALTVFGPGGDVVRERISFATDEDAATLFAATEAGDHLVVVDHLMSIGPAMEYELRVATRASVNCSTTACASGSFAAGQEKLLRFDLSSGDLLVLGLALPDTATTTLETRLLAEGLTPLADVSSATQYGPAKAMYYASAAQRVYLLVREHDGEAVASYSLDARQYATPLLASGAAGTALPVWDMPADTYPPAGVAHFVGSAGQVAVSTDLVVPAVLWTDPVEELVSPDFVLTGPALDTTAAAFPNSPLTPLLQWIPAQGHYLYRVKDGAGADIVGATYDTTLHLLDPGDLGAPSVSSPSQLTNQHLHAGTGLGVFRFTADVGAQTSIVVTPQGGAAMQPEVWVATPGSSAYASGQYSWVSDATSGLVGVLARGSAAAQGGAASVTHTTTYDGAHLVFVRDLGGLGASDAFDVQVTVSN